MKLRFETDDGKVFDTEALALAYEQEQERKAYGKFEKYLKTYSGKKLLEQYTLSTEGLWEVFGEDPNCDFGGYHYKPRMGLVEGKLEDVIRWAVAQGGFWQWGGGGDFELRTLKKIVKTGTSICSRTGKPTSQCDEHNLHCAYPKCKVLENVEITVS